jgi:hypothetical protein
MENYGSNQAAFEFKWGKGRPKAGALYGQTPVIQFMATFSVFR